MVAGLTRGADALEGVVHRLLEALGQGREVQRSGAKERGGRLVPGDRHPVEVVDDDGVGEAVHHRLQAVVGVEQLAQGALPILLEARRHLVERSGERGDLVAAPHLDPGLEVAGGEPVHGPLQSPDRARTRRSQAPETATARRKAAAAVAARTAPMRAASTRARSLLRRMASRLMPMIRSTAASRVSDLARCAARSPGPATVTRPARYASQSWRRRVVAACSPGSVMLCSWSPSCRPKAATESPASAGRNGRPSRLAVRTRRSMPSTARSIARPASTLRKFWWRISPGSEPKRAAATRAPVAVRVRARIGGAARAAACAAGSRARVLRREEVGYRSRGHGGRGSGAR